MHTTREGARGHARVGGKRSKVKYSFRKNLQGIIVFSMRGVLQIRDS